MSLCFTLTAILSDDDNVCSTEAPQLPPAIHPGTGTVVVTAKQLRISQSADQRADAQPHLAAIFVPPALVDASWSEVAQCGTYRQGIRCSLFHLNQASLFAFSQTLLPMIHPLLVQDFVIHSIILVRNEQHAPSDVILLDISNAPTSIASELLELTNGESIQARYGNVLKVILVSEVVFASEVSVSNVLESPSFDLPTCPVCLHRIDPSRLGLPKPRNHQLCSNFCPLPDYLNETPDVSPCPRQELLKPWPPPSHCICCRTLSNYWTSPRGLHLANADENDEEFSQVFCYDCALRETLWVCMTCGYVGCGRYSNKHAAKHFSESHHPFSLELATLRVWDYVGGEYVHRVDFLQCPCCVLSSSNRHSLASTAFAPSAASGSSKWQSDSTDGPFPTAYAQDAGQMDMLAYHQAYSDSNLYTHQDEKSHKKASVISEEYEALLLSALEEQAQHYEGKLSRLLAALTAESVDTSSISLEEQRLIDGLHNEINQLRREIEVVGRDLLDAQAQEAGYRATSNRLLREQQVAEALLKTVQDDTALEQQEASRQMEELEQQIADLTANHRMRSQFSQDDELAQAQIFGTVSSAEKPGKKSMKKLLRRAKK